MKKCFLLLTSFYVFAGPLLAWDFSYQKQIFVAKDALAEEHDACQAVYIAPEWLLTAAHCITPLVSATDYEVARTPDTHCTVRIILAQEGDVAASAVIPCSEVSFPKEIINKKGEKVLPFDLALLHYKDGSVPYEYYLSSTGQFLRQETFEEFCKQNKFLGKKWKSRVPPQFPTLYTVKKEENQKYPVLPLLVPNMGDGDFSYAAFFAAPRFIGDEQKDPTTAQAYWAARDFGVAHGDSGSSIMVREKDGSLKLLGIVSASAYHSSSDARDPQAQLVAFIGFDKDVSLSFIKPLIENNRLAPLPQERDRRK